MKKILFYIYFLIVLLWSIVYGAIIGFLGGFVSWYKNMARCIRDSLMNRKSYPQASFHKHMAYYLNAIGNEYEKTRVEKEYKAGQRKPSHPFVEAFTVFAIYLPLIVYFPIKGFFLGPYHVLGHCLDYWDNKFEKGGINEKR